MTGSQDIRDDSTQKVIPDDRELDLACYDDISQWSAAIAFEVVKLMQTWSSEAPFVIHVKTTQGTGKSLGDMETVPLHIGPTAVFGPRHEDIKEDANHPALQSIFEVHFEGKDASCENEKYAGRHYRVHSDVSGSWCQQCSMRSNCSYFEPYDILDTRGFATGPDTSDPEFGEYKMADPAWSDNGLKGYTAVHQLLPYHPDVLDQWGAIEAVIIDESPWEAIGERTATLPLSDIRQAHHATQRLQENEGSHDLPVEILSDLQTALAQLEDLVGGEPNRKNHELTFSTWVELTEKCENHEITDPVTRAVSRERENTGHTGTGLVVGPLLEGITHIKEHTDRAWKEFESLVNQRPPKAFWLVENDVIRLRWMDTTTLRKIASEKPVCILATEMPSDLVRTMFDLPVVTITDNLAPEVDVLQLDTRKAGITALRNRGKLWKDLLELTDQALQLERTLGNKVFIAVKKDLKKREDETDRPGVLDHLENRGFEEGVDFEIGHYYGLTGSNRFEDCDAVILFGMPRLSDEVANYKALLSGLTADEFHAQNTEGELRDALHRIRPAKKDGVRAYIWTNVVDFEDEFSGEYQREGVPDLRRHLKQQIEQEKEGTKLRKAIIEFVQAYDGKPTATEITREVSGGHRKIQRYRDELEKEGILEVTTESDGSGRPTKKYRLSESLSN